MRRSVNNLIHTTHTLSPEGVAEVKDLLRRPHHHHRPINVPTAGAQAIRRRRMANNPPRGPSAGW
jgi:hypothetical protein